jgi:hypothetical protein
MSDALNPDADLTPEQLEGMDTWARDPAVFQDKSRAVWALLVTRAVREIRRRRADATGHSHVVDAGKPTEFGGEE